MTLELPGALLDRAAYPHDVEDLRMIETHMSWIFLTGQFAYKVKKPVTFDFVDFASRSARKKFCQRELELNHRFAPSLYIDVLPIYATATGVKLSSSTDESDRAGDVVDWAVKMHQFPVEQQCDYLLSEDGLTPDLFYDFGIRLAQTHLSLPVSDRSTIREDMQSNFDTLKSLSLPEQMDTQLGFLEKENKSSLDRYKDILASRTKAGKVRRCHGDLHLGNLVVLNDAITAFDCLEFSDAISETDVWADVAFLFMDLTARGYTSLAYAFIDGYLNESGDYHGAELLNLFAQYRAMVRAKVSGLRYAQTNDAADLEQVQRYIDWAVKSSSRDAGKIVMTNGLSGCGKSFWSEQLARHANFIRIRSDVFRKTSANLSPQAKTHSKIAQGLYAPETSLALYESMAHVALSLAKQGECVVIDAAFLFSSQRKLVSNILVEAGLKPILITFVASLDTLRHRIKARAQGNDPSEAGQEVLDWQIAHQEQPTQEEEFRTFNTESNDLSQLINLIGV